MGLVEALSWVHELEMHHVVFESDAKGVVDALYSSKMDNFKFGSLIQKCRGVLAMHSDYVVSLI
ncbi:hypothetical protein PTKIN_Ptkin17bG0114300 [Pterospermum kingtungense]